MLRIAGGPARGWYPKQRQNRPVSNENLDRIHSGRAWDSGTSNRKPLTLPPNLSPNFFKKSPTDALRRVTSLLIRKGEKGKDADKRDKIAQIPNAHRSFDAGGFLALLFFGFRSCFLWKDLLLDFLVVTF